MPDPVPAAPGAEPTILTPAPTAPGAGSPTPDGGTPKADPNGQPAPKPDGSAPSPSAPKPDDAKPPQGAPEKYADFKLPDGLQIDTKLQDEFRSVAKSLNLTQEAAQQLVDLQIKTVTQSQEQAMASFQKMNEAWRQESLKALGPKPAEELAFASKARDQFATPELLKVFSETGLGNHPEVVKLFVKLGKAVAEDHFADGKGSSTTTKDPAAVLYGNSK